ncbi:hypothetical protein N2152v2_009500 [Parachlorella kessleri]
MASEAGDALKAAEHLATEAKKLSSEGETLAEDVTSLCKRLDKALKDATYKLGTQGPDGGSGSTEAEAVAAAEGSEEEDQQREDGWVPVVKELEAARNIIYGNGVGGDLRKFMKIRRPAILSFLLGVSTYVVTVRKEQSLKLKEEYHGFRTRSAYTILGLASALHVGLRRARARAAASEEFSLTPIVTVGTQLFLCWFLYYYTAAALRESVLRMNGSHIRPWWIMHHYWSIAATMLMLSLPADSPSFARAAEMFLWWAMLQALVILMQNTYQRRRMYTRIAMGKNSPHDVVSGESSGTHGQLLLLYPMLFVLQGFQFYIGVDMMLGTFWAFMTPEGYLDPERKETDLWGSRGVFLAGAMMTYMAVMNFLNTVATLIGKRAAREKAIFKGVTRHLCQPSAELRSPTAMPPQ